MKEHLRAQLASFFISVTLINLAMLILGCLLEPDLEFGYSAFAYPLIYGVIGSLPGLVMYSKKELTVKQAIIRQIVNVILIIAIIEIFMFGGKAMTKELTIIALSVAVSIAIVYIGVEYIMYRLDLKDAQNMTDKLKSFQNSIGDV